MSVISYKCPNCGGDLRFDPQSQKYKCEFCVSLFNQEELEDTNPQAKAGTAQEGAEESHAMVYSCPSCGAEVVTDETTAATFCYYCHNPVVLKGRLEGEYLPEKVIPFQIDRESALKQFLDYVKKKKFVPGAFFNQKQVEKLTGVYFPYWVCREEMQGELRATATNVRIWRAGEIEYTETKFYDVERAGNIHLEELTRNALQKANRELVEGVLPFPLQDGCAFSMGYLSGFQAEKRDLEKKDLQGEVVQESEGYAKKLLRDSIHGYATVTTKDARISVDSEEWDYVLLPVWTLTYRCKDGKLFYYAMNGATGRVCGKLPIDYGKIAILFLAIFIPVLMLGLLGGYFI